jgi:hypothetical protein
MAEKVGEAFVEYFIKSAKAVKGLADIERQSDETDKELTKLQKTAKKTAKFLGDTFKTTFSTIKQGASIAAKAFTVASVAAVGFTKKWSDAAAELGGTATNLGITISQLKELRGVAKLAGVDGEDLTDTIKDLSVRLHEAQKEAGPAREQFSRLGLSVDDMLKASPIEQLGMFADALNNLESESEGLQIRDELLGDVGLRMGKLFEQGSFGIDKAARRVGQLTDASNANIKASAELNEQWNESNIVVNDLFEIVSEGVIPALTDLVKETKDWIIANKHMLALRIERLFKLIFKMLSDIVPKLASAAEWTIEFAESVGGLDKAMIILISTLGSFGIAAFGLFGPASPWVAGLAGAVALVMALTTNLDEAREAQDRLNQERIQGLKDASDVSTFRARGLAGEDNENLTGSVAGNKVLFEERRLKQLQDQLPSEADVKKLRELVKAGKESDSKLSFGSSTLRDIPFFGSALGQSSDLDDLVGGFESELKKVDILIAKVNAQRGRVNKAFKSFRDEEARQRNQDLARSKNPQFARLQKEFQSLNKQHGLKPGGLKGSKLARLQKLQSKLPGVTILEPPNKKRVKKKKDKEEDKVLSLQEKVAELLGTGSGLSASTFRPAGLGTLVQRIDASITFNMGDVNVQQQPVPAGSAPSEAGRIQGQSAFSALTDSLRKAWQAQKGMIIG